MIALIKTILRRIRPFVFNEKKSKPSEQVTYDQKRAVINFYRTKYKLKILVETGTFLGDTVFFFKDKFEQLYSIELSKDLAQRATQRFAHDDNITILQGNSADSLGSISNALKTPALFWLDGHYSSEFFYEGEYIVTAKADKNTPIEKELDILLTSDFSNVILIDDARLFIGKNDYPTVDAIKKKVKSAKKKYKVHVDKDIIHILPCH